MINELIKMLEMQKMLDASIFEKHGIKEYPYENMRIALLVELGELLNELPTKFKHWKKTAVDNRDKALVEYVDCLHFALSLHNYYNFKIDIEALEKSHNFEYMRENSKSYSVAELLENIVRSKALTLHYTLVLGYKLGFTWKEIYGAYMAKNEVNYGRLASGY